MGDCYTISLRRKVLWYCDWTNRVILGLDKYHTVWMDA